MYWVKTKLLVWQAGPGKYSFSLEMSQFRNQYFWDSFELCTKKNEMTGVAGKQAQANIIFIGHVSI